MGARRLIRRAGAAGWRPTGARWAGAAAAALALTGCASSAGEQRALSPPSPAATAAERTAVTDVLASFRSPRDLVAPAEPVRVRIPSLGVDAAVGPVAKNPDGTVEVPSRWEDVGWYSEGPRPGEAGPAVLLGHVDSRAGPAVFAEVARLVPGDVVEVADADGGLRSFSVTRVQRFPKDRFPTEEVYLPTLSSEIRLVTCGGAFDRATGHYLDNVIAYAVPRG